MGIMEDCSKLEERLRRIAAVEAELEEGVSEHECGFRSLYSSSSRSSPGSAAPILGVDWDCPRDPDRTQSAPCLGATGSRPRREAGRRKNPLSAFVDSVGRVVTRPFKTAKPLPAPIEEEPG